MERRSLGFGSAAGGRLLLVSAGLTAILCAACSGGSNPGKTVVRFWQFWPAATVEPLIQAFESANPDIDVEMQQLTWGSGLEKITASVVGGNPPDLCELGSTWFAKFAASGALRSLREEAEPLRPDYHMWEAGTYENQVFAFPWLTGTRALFYNRTLALDAGLDPDRPPETWGDLARWVKAMHDPETHHYGWGLNSGERYVQYKKFMPFAWGNGGRVLDPETGECAVAEDAVVQALDFYLSLKPYALLEKQEVLDQAFRDGRLGAMISGAWLLKTLPRDAPDLEFGVALVPKPFRDTGIHASFGGGELLAIFARSKHPKEALRLATFLMERPQAMAIARAEVSVLPAAKGAEGDAFFQEDPRRAVFLRQLETAVFPPNHAEWVRIEDSVDSALEEAVYERMTPREALAHACRDIQGILTRAGNSK